MNRTHRTICGLYFALCVALSSCSSVPRTNLSRDDAIRIAQEKLAQDFLAGRDDLHYDRINVSYLPDDRTWVVLYQETKSGSRCVVQVKDRTGESQILLP